MKIKDILYQTPEMTEEKLLEIMEHEKSLLNLKSWSRNKYKDMKEVLEEFDAIQLKKSNLSKDQRDQLFGFVSTCLILMTKGYGGKTSGTD